MFKYDPHQKTGKEIKETFINGKKYLEDILDDLKPKNNKRSNQSIIITGQRGTGKSHFLIMAALRINSDEQLSRHYLPVIFPEELFKVTSLYHFLKDGIERVFSSIKGKSILPNAETDGLKNEFQGACSVRFAGSKKEQKNQYIEIENIFFSLLTRISRAINRKFIFLLENLQDLFGQKLSLDDLKRLRGFLQESPDTLLIIGSAVSVFERAAAYGDPFYNFFKFRQLTGLDKDEVKWFLETTGSLRGNPGISDRIRRFHGEIEVFRILTGGNPRLILFLYDLLEENEELVIEDILKKITELTPYFKSETEKLSASKQAVIDALCENAPAQTPSEIAGYLNESIGIVIENLKRLIQDGKAKIVGTEKGEDIKKSETFYSVSDYFYRVWYQIRQSVFLNENLKWMAELASLLFKKTELEEKFKTSHDQMRPVFQKALELLQDESFMRFKNQLFIALKEEDSLFWEKIIELADKNAVDLAYFVKGLSYEGLGKIDKAAENYVKYIHVIEDLFLLAPHALKGIKTHAYEYFSKEKSVRVLTNPKMSLEKQLEAVRELLCIDQFNGIETLTSALFEKLEETKPGKRPQKKVKELLFYLMFETILRLKNESGESNPVITARYFLRIALLLKNRWPVELQILAFLFNYTLGIEKQKINKESLMEIISEWEKMNIVLPESIIALIDALKNPKSRAAQVWSTDPLFKEVLKMLEQ